jgi:hypothetical protein
MPRPCSICTNAQRVDLEASVLSGASIRATARASGISPFALRRHLQHVATIVTQRVNAEAQQAAAGGSLKRRVEEIIADARRIMKAAETKEQFGTALQGIRTQLACLELIAKLSGELRSGSMGEVIPATGATAAASASVTMTLPVAPAKNPQDLIRLLKDIYHLHTPVEDRRADGDQPKPPVM